MAETKVLSDDALKKPAKKPDAGDEAATETKPLAPPGTSARPFDEGTGIEVRFSEGTESYGPKGWSMLEISTQNRIYRLNASLVCVEVADKETKKPAAAHGLLGARLVGGQKRDGEKLTLFHPFPVVGTEAVFEKRTKDVVSLSTSSTVTRVVLNLRRVQAGTGERASWDEISLASEGKEDVADGDELAALAFSVSVLRITTKRGGAKTKRTQGR